MPILQNTPSTPETTKRRAWGVSTFWWLVIFFWLIVSLASALEIALLHTVSTSQALLETFIRLVPWIFMTVVIVWISSVWTLDRTHWKRSIWIYLLACAFSLGVVAALAYFGPPPPLFAGQNAASYARLTGDSRSMMFLVLWRTTYQLPTFWGLVAVAHAIRFYEREKVRELREAELQARLIQARLQALQLQLNPHFLFNTLNSIASLVHENPTTAEKMIEALSDLLRLTLNSTDRQRVTVREELHFLEQYLLIERIRFGERLRVETQIDEAVLDDLVPALILQPLVENAVKHGVEAQIAPGLVRIAAQPDGSWLRLEVSDNGPVFKNAAVGKIEERVGLTNTRARLQEMFGSQATLELQPGKAGGFTTRILVPRQAAQSRSTPRAEFQGAL